MKVKSIRQSFSGDAEPATKQELKQRTNKAYVCQFFGVRANTPGAILKKAIQAHTGKNMSFGAFKYLQTKKETNP